MIAADAFASIDIAPILPFIFLRSRKTRERLPIASDRLPPAFDWILMTMAKKLASVIGNPLSHLVDRFGERQTHRLRFHDHAEFAAHRLGGLVGDDAQAVAERQARLDAAHDDVDRVGKFRDEFLDAPFAHCASTKLGKPSTPMTAAGAAI